MSEDNPQKPTIKTNLMDLQKSALELGFNQLGWTALSQPLTLEFYEKWISQDYHGSMDYLREHLQIKKNPQALHENLCSALVVTHPYFPTQYPSTPSVPARVAKYAQNSDYHYWLKDKIKQLIQNLQSQYPNKVFLPFTDSGPIMERDLGVRAGLGWFGKNTCLIHPQKGSLFFIGEILTSLSSADFGFTTTAKPNAPLQHARAQSAVGLLSPDQIAHAEGLTLETLPDFCGKCTRCLDICPTQALESPRVLNATKCISFLTIESKKTPPLELRSKMGDWFFGCDLCQTVCPWNDKIFKFAKSENALITNENIADDEIDFFRFILSSSNKKLQKHFFGSPLLRATAFGLKRNTLIVIANKKIVALQDEVSALRTDPKLAELAQWCLESLTNKINRDK